MKHTSAVIHAQDTLQSDGADSIFLTDPADAEMVASLKIWEENEPNSITLCVGWGPARTSVIVRVPQFEGQSEKEILLEVLEAALANVRDSDRI